MASAAQVTEANANRDIDFALVRDLLRFCCSQFLHIEIFIQNRFYRLYYPNLVFLMNFENGSLGPIEAPIFVIFHKLTPKFSKNNLCKRE